MITWQLLHKVITYGTPIGLLEQGQELQIEEVLDNMGSNVTILVSISFRVSLLCICFEPHFGQYSYFHLACFLFSFLFLQHSS